MNQNENPLGPSPRALEAMSRWASAVHRYDLCEGPILQEKLEQQISAVRDDDSLAVIIGNGADHLIGVACYAAVAHQGGEIIEPEFSYGRASDVALALSEQADLPCHVIRTPMGECLDIDLSAITNAISDWTKAIFLTNPNNPTGILISSAMINEWLIHIPRRIIIVLDEAYIHFCNDVDLTSSLSIAENNPNVLLIRTFSKIYGLAALRLAYGSGNRALIQRLLPWNTAEAGPWVQKAGAAALDDEEYVSESRRLAVEFKNQVRTVLNSYTTNVLPSQTNFISFQVKCRELAVLDALDRGGIRVARFKHRVTGDWIRVSMGTLVENAYFCSVLRSALAESLH